MVVAADPVRSSSISATENLAVQIFFSFDVPLVVMVAAEVLELLWIGGGGALAASACAQHTATTIVVILGRRCGPSSTSGMEAISIFCRCLTPPGYQVVRPRDPGCGRWTDLVVGGEPSSALLSDLGGDA
jgi:hypothetical protein